MQEQVWSNNGKIRIEKEEGRPQACCKVPPVSNETTSPRNVTGTAVNHACLSKLRAKYGVTQYKRQEDVDSGQEQSKLQKYLSWDQEKT